MIFIRGDVARYTGAVIGHGDSLIMRGDRVIVTEGNEDFDDAVTVVLASNPGGAVPAFANVEDLTWLDSA